MVEKMGAGHYHPINRIHELLPWKVSINMTHTLISNTLIKRYRRDAYDTVEKLQL
jgi:hypothetical protein